MFLNLNRLTPLALLASLFLSSGLVAGDSKRDQRLVGHGVGAFHQATAGFHAAQPSTFYRTFHGADTFHQATLAPDTVQASSGFHAVQPSTFHRTFHGADAFHQATLAPVTVQGTFHDLSP